MSVTLTTAEYEATVTKVARINDRAAKRGFTGRLSVDATREVRTNTRNGHNLLLNVSWLPEGAEYIVWETAITGEAPAYDGWTFLARIDARPQVDGSTGWTVNCAPGVLDTDVDRSILRSGACDHCNTVRVNRAKIMLVRNTETGEYKQVGTTCIKDFLGWSAMPVFYSTSDVEGQMDDGWGSFGGGSAPEFTPTYVLAVAHAAVQVMGWAAKSSGKPPTSGLVSDYLFGGNSKAAIEARKEIDPIIGAAQEIAPTILTTVRDEFAASTYGYEANVYAVLNAQSVTSRDYDVLTSVVPAYERIVGNRAAREVEAAARAAKPEPTHLGAKSDKVEFTGVITLALTVDGFSYNSTQRMIVVETETALVKLYTAAGWAYDVVSGDTVTLKATVKDLDTFKGQQQTVVTRAKRVDVPVAA